MLVKVNIKTKTEKLPLRLFCKISRIVLVLSVVLRLVVLIMDLCGVSLYLGGEVNPSYLLLGFDAFILAMAVCSFNFREKKLYLFPILLALLILGIYTSSLVSTNKNVRYKDFSSPDNKTEIVLRERGYMYSGETLFYKRISPLFISRLDQKIALNDGYQPIARARVGIDWGDDYNTALITYYEEQTDEQIYQISLDLT